MFWQDFILCQELDTEIQIWKINNLGCLNILSVHIYLE